MARFHNWFFVIREFMGAYRKDIRVFFPAHTLGKRHTNHIKKKNAMPKLPYDTAGKTLTFDFHTLSLG